MSFSIDIIPLRGIAALLLTIARHPERSRGISHLTAVPVVGVRLIE
jgi:hypothetical protein